MKKLLFFLFLLAPALLHAQGSSLQQSFINNVGRPLAGVSVLVCEHVSSPATNPCMTTLATLYNNVELNGSPIANPTVTDALGNLLVYVAPGDYDYTVSGNGFASRTYTVTVGGSGSGGGLTSGTITGPVILTPADSSSYLYIGETDSIFSGDLPPLTGTHLVGASSESVGPNGNAGVTGLLDEKDASAVCPGDSCGSALFGLTFMSKQALSGANESQGAYNAAIATNATGKVNVTGIYAFGQGDPTGSGTVGILRGGKFAARLSTPNATADNIYDIDLLPISNATSGIAVNNDIAGIHIPALDAANVFNKPNYGVKIEDQGTTSNKWGIYDLGTNNKHRLVNIITSSVNNILYVDGIKYTTIQACVTAAAALSSPGTCVVPTGTANASQVEMASGVTLQFEAGTFTNTTTTGGIYIHFASGVTGAIVKGEGKGSTYLRNNSTGTQFGAVIQDEGTNNTIADLTADGNGNTTSTVISKQATKPNYHNLLIVHDTTVVSMHSYALDIRGGNNFNFDSIETNGGALGGVSITTADGNGNYGSITGGNISNFYLHNSPHNGLDINVNASAVSVTNSIAAINFVNVLSQGNGTVNAHGDDEYGVALNADLVSGDTGSMNNLNFSNLWVLSNYGSGLRMKGNIFNSIIMVNAASNAIDTTATSTDAITILTGTVAGSHTTLSTFIATGNKGGATNFLTTNSSSNNNLFQVNTADPVNLQSTTDTIVKTSATPGQLYLGQNILVPGTVTTTGLGLNGTGAGFWGAAAGADNCVANQPANSVCWEAPASVPTAYHGLFASAPSTGFPFYTYSLPAITESIVNPYYSCGTTTTCANTAIAPPKIIFGSVALGSGTPSTATITAISPAFTSSSTYVCVATPQAAAGAPVSVVNVSGSSFTITGPNTVTTVVNYQCTGN